MHGDPLLLNITTEILPNQKPVRKSYRALPGVMMGTGKNKEGEMYENVFCIIIAVGIVVITAVCLLHNAWKFERDMTELRKSNELEDWERDDE
jgi:hypothetical protein